MEAAAKGSYAHNSGMNGYAAASVADSDQELIALVRVGDELAFEALVDRYRGPLLSLCRRMVGSDAEDMLQETFASAYRAICADARTIAPGPWLHTIARNHCLSHLRRPPDPGPGSIEVVDRRAETTAEAVERREEFRELVSDVLALPPAQRAALVLHELDSLPYKQVAAAMDRTVPGIKSLLVRARTSLAEAAEARRLTCTEVRLQLERAADGAPAPVSGPVRRHAESCAGCRTYKRSLRTPGRARAALLAVALVFGAEKLSAKLTAGSKKGAALAAEGKAGGSAAAGGSSVTGGGAAAGGTGSAVSAGSAVAGGSTAIGGSAAVGGGGLAGLVSAGAGTLVVQAAGGLIAASVVAAGGVAFERALDGEDTARHSAAAAGEQLPPADPSVRAPETMPVTSGDLRDGGGDWASLLAERAADASTSAPSDLRQRGEALAADPRFQDAVAEAFAEARARPLLEWWLAHRGGAPPADSGGSTSSSSATSGSDSTTGSEPTSGYPGSGSESTGSDSSSGSGTADGDTTDPAAGSTSGSGSTTETDASASGTQAGG